MGRRIPKPINIRESDKTRLMQRMAEAVVNANLGECIEWLWYREPKGYGHVRAGGRVCRAHRVYYVLAKGQIKPGGTIHHKCNNAACINPLHLSDQPIGTHNNQHVPDEDF